MADGTTEKSPFIGQDSKSPPDMKENHFDGPISLELGNGLQEGDPLAAELRALIDKLKSNDINQLQHLKAHEKICLIARGLPNAFRYCKDMQKFLNTLESSESLHREQFEDSRQLYTSRLGSVKKWIFVSLAALTLIIVATILACTLSNSNNDTSQDTCKDPDNYFKPLSYQNGTDTVWIKYNVSSNPLKFAASEEKCKKLGSELWEVLDGEPEWDALIHQLNKIDKDMETWIRGEIEDCPPGEKCEKQDAEVGLGIPMKRSQPQRYSRLYGDKNENTCVSVNGGNWLRRKCDALKISVCVLRGCKENNPV